MKDYNEGRHESLYMSVEEVSEKLGVSKFRIINLIRNGILNGILFQTVDGPDGLLLRTELPYVK